MRIFLFKPFSTNFFYQCFLLLVILCVGACEKNVHVGSVSRSIDFELMYQGESLNCERLSRLPIKLNDFRFYIHDFKQSHSGVSLLESKWQSQNVALLDFAATQRLCDSSEQRDFNQSVKFRYSRTKGVIPIGFSLGVPATLNHQNPVKAVPPLNRSDMHWQWLSGYKFLRLEYENGTALKRFHLGSFGCSGKIPDAVDCKYPNTMTIHLENYDLETSIIEVHLDALLNNKSSVFCMGNPLDKTCSQWIMALKNDVFKIGNTL